MKIRHPLEYLLVRGLEWLCRLLPRGVSLGLAGLLGRAWFALDRRRRGRALLNLETAMGDRLGAAERRAVALECFRNLARSLCDVLTLDRWDEEKVDRLVTVEGWKHVETAYRRRKGVLLFSGHIGCWELVPHLQAQGGLPLSLVVRPLDNPLLNRLLDRRRRHSGNETIAKRQAVRAILRRLRRGGGVAIVIDQNLRSPERIFVEFFGRPAATTPALALAALRTGAAVVPVFCLPRPDGTYLVRYLPAVDLPEGGGRAHEVHALTQRCTGIIEETVRRHPEAWLWMHRRWRTSPGTGDQGASGGRPASDLAASG